MDDRSFGQLVYDKKMRLIVGTQSDSVALEVDTLRHGLLTYSLVRNGLQLKKADFNPLDHSITISEWFQYALQNVGDLTASITAGRQIDAGVTVKRASIFGLDTTSSTLLAQRPVIFDYGWKVAPVLWGQPFFDMTSVQKVVDIDQTEFEVAAKLADPVASAAALKRFISHHQPGAATAAAWPFVTANLIESRASSIDLISAARLSLAHLSLIQDANAAAMAASVMASVAKELDRRHDYPEVVNEFRGIAKQIISQ